MKSWNGHGDARVAPRQASAGVRVLTAAFASLIIIAGLDTIFPGLGHRLIPQLKSQPQAEAGHAAKSFEWSQVRSEHS